MGQTKGLIGLVWSASRTLGLHHIFMLFYLSRNVADEFERQDVWKWQTHELVPVSSHHFRHVESGQECDGDHALEPERKAK